MGGEGQAGRPCPPPQPKSPRADADGPQDQFPGSTSPGHPAAFSRPRRSPGAPAEESTGCLWMAAHRGGSGRAGRKPLSRGRGSRGPAGSPSPLTQEGTPSMSRQLLAASPWRRCWCTPGTQRHGVHLHPLCPQKCGLGGGGAGRPHPRLTQDSPSSGGRQSHSCSPRARSPRSPTFLQKVSSRLTSPQTPPGDQERGRGSRWARRAQQSLPRRGRLCGNSTWGVTTRSPQGAVGAQGDPPRPCAHQRSPGVSTTR